MKKKLVIGWGIMLGAVAVATFERTAGAQPVVTLSGVTEAQVFTNPTSITLTTLLTDRDINIQRRLTIFDRQIGGTTNTFILFTKNFGSEIDPVYATTFVWDSPPLGIHDLWVVADNSVESPVGKVTSATNRITVTGNLFGFTSQLNLRTQPPAPTPNDDIVFGCSLVVSNQTRAPSNPLRVRLLSVPVFFHHQDASPEPDPFEDFPATFLPGFEPTNSGLASNSAWTIVINTNLADTNIVCPAFVFFGDHGYQYQIYALLEEQVAETNWFFVDRVKVISSIFRNLTPDTGGVPGPSLVPNTNSSGYLLDLALGGPSTVDERSNVTFTCLATYSSGYVGPVVPSWSAPPYTVAPGGVLTVGSVSSNTSLTVAAAFTRGAITKTAITDVVIIDLPCTYSIAPIGALFSADGGVSSLLVMPTDAYCPWTTTNTNSWITITANSNGVGTGSVFYAVAANATCSQRAGTLTVAGETFSVMQDQGVGTFSISPTNTTAGANGGGGTVMVSGTPGCSWTTSKTNDWIVITNGNGGTGDGTVGYLLLPNTNCAARSGTVTIAGQPFIVTQAEGMGTFAISPTNEMVAPFSRSSTVLVMATPGCSWTAFNTNNWIVITSGATGTGNGMVRYAVASNTNCASRQGTFLIAGQTFTVTQAGGLGDFVLSRTNALFAPNGGSGTVQVSGTPDCPWVTVNQNPWIVISSGTNGIGNGTVSYEVTRNTNMTARTGLVVIARQTFTVKQAGLEKVKPTVTISSPLNARLFTALTNLTGTANDNAGLERVEVQVGSNVFPYVTGTTNWSAALPLMPGTNVVQATSVDTSGNRSMTVIRQYSYVVTSPLTLLTNGYGTITGATNGQNLEIGRNYTLTATPRAGSVFSNWTGSVTASTDKLTFRMQSNYVLRANFVTNPFIAAMGSYNGLVYEDDQVRPERSGSFRFTLAQGGAFTGQLKLGGKAYSLTGRFGLDGQSSSAVPLSRTNNLRLDLMFDWTTNSDRVVGSLVSSNPVWTATVLGDKAPVYLGTNSSPYTNKYTLVIPGYENDVTRPAGDGFATFTVDKKGTLTLAATLADGTPLTQSLPVSKNGDWPWYSSLYGGKGSVLGWLSLNTNRPSGSLTGELSWIKLTMPTPKVYTNGFTNQVPLLGSVYHVPATNRVLMFTNAQVDFHGGHLSAPFTNLVTLLANNMVSNRTTIRPLTLTFTLPSGRLNGNVTIPDGAKTRTLQFKGAVLQQQKYGAGFFVDTNLSGRLHFGP